MGRLLAYKKATTQKAKALAAIEVAGHKRKELAWQWSQIAIDHARAAGIAHADDLVGGSYGKPKCSRLKAALTSLHK